MTTTVTDPILAGGDTGTEFRDVHLYCDCTPDLGLCSTDLTGRPETDNDATCVVCTDMENSPCPRCGE